MDFVSALVTEFSNKMISLSQLRDKMGRTNQSISLGLLVNQPIQASISLSSLKHLASAHMYLRDVVNDNWVDLTGSGQNGVYYGGTLTTTRFGGGWVTPASQTSRYVMLPEARLQSLPSGIAWTLNMWFEIVSLPSSFSNILSMATNTSFNALLLYIYSTHIAVGSYPLVQGAQLPTSLNTPFMLTLTRSSALFSLYRNGVYAATYSGTNAPNTRAITGWILDHDQDSLKGGFSSSQNTNGNFYEMSMFTRVLTNAEILSEFMRTKSRYGL